MECNKRMLEDKLKNKNVLVIMPYYFSYELKIKEVLQNAGANVFLINENIDELSIWNRLIFLYTKKQKDDLIKKYYHKFLQKLQKPIDFLLVIKGRTLSEEIVSSIKKQFPTAKLFMYQWDSVSVCPNAVELSKLFDFCFTFDPIDAQELNWHYRPLFFVPLEKKEQKKIYDVSFVCSLHSKRAEILRKINKIAKEKNYKFYIYLYSPFGRFIRQKYIKHNNTFQIENKFIKFKKLSSARMTDIYRKSKCTVDYKFPEQHGLTMRTIESMGYGCKLITNNASVKNEDFYNENNILIYDEENLVIPEEFVNSPYAEIGNEIYERYTIQGWIREIFETI